jgi:hypothetical protein
VRYSHHCLEPTTQEVTMSTAANVERTIDAYFAMWNEVDAARRNELIEQTWTSDAHYLDPMLEARGYEELSEMVARVHQQFPGHRFSRTSGIDGHNALIRFGWRLVSEDGEVAAAGLDVGVVADDGRLQRIAGFLGDLPAAA